MSYSPSPIPSADVSALLNAQWATYSGNVPEPTMYDVNATDNPQLRAEFRNVDVLFISASDLPERPIGTWYYADQTVDIRVEIFSSVSRQRIYDLVKEIARICHDNMHSMTNYQRIQYTGFYEETADAMNIWHGIVNIQLLNSAARIRSGQ